MKITITKRAFKQFYIYNYFFAQNGLINNMRRFMGPILTAIGLYLYLFSNVKESSVYGYWFVVISLAYGMFYTVKPLLLVLTLRAKDETFEYKIENNRLFIKDRVREGEISLEESPLLENKKYYYVKLENKQIIFFPKELLNDKAVAMFSKFVK